MNRIANIVTALALSMTVHGCFTGVESTPRIGNSELRRQNAADPTAERQYLADIATESLGKWRSGKMFVVEDRKAMLNFGIK